MGSERVAIDKVKVSSLMKGCSSNRRKAGGGGVEADVEDPGGWVDRER